MGKTAEEMYAEQNAASLAQVRAVAAATDGIGRGAGGNGGAFLQEGYDAFEREQERQLADRWALREGEEPF